MLLFKDLSNNPGLDQTKAKSLVDFISRAITDGQKLAPNLGYVPLPAEVVKNVQDTLKSLTFKGTPLYGNPVRITNVVVNEYFFFVFLVLQILYVRSNGTSFLLALAPLNHYSEIIGHLTQRRCTQQYHMFIQITVKNNQ